MRKKKAGRISTGFFLSVIEFGGWINIKFIQLLFNPISKDVVTPVFCLFSECVDILHERFILTNETIVFRHEKLQPFFQSYVQKPVYRV